MSYIKSYLPGTKIVATAASGFKADYYTDGTADNVQLIAAIAGGGKVLVRKGDYYLDSRFLVDVDNLDIEFEEGAWLHKNDYNGDIVTVSADNVKIRNIHVNGHRSTATWDNQGIVIRDSTNVYVYSPYITEVVHHGLNTPGSTNVYIYDGYSENNGMADGGGFSGADGVGFIAGDLATNVHLINCHAVNNGYHSFQVYTSSTDVHLVGCVGLAPGQTQVTGSGLKINPDCSNIHITDCEFDGTGSGNSSAGLLMLTGVAQPVDNVSITGTRIHGFAQSGIDIQGATNVTISDTTYIYNNGQNTTSSGDYGIKINDGAGSYITNHIKISAKIYDNQGSPTQARPIGLYGGSTNIIADNLEIYGHVTSNAIFKDAAYTGTLYEGTNIGSTGYNNVATGTEPRIILTETDTGTNSKRWDLRADSGSMYIRTLSDNDATRNNVMHFTRSNTTPTGILFDVTTTFKAGTTSTAPLLLTSGTNLTSPAAGAIEFDGTSLYFTPSATRKTIAYLDSNITGTSAGLSSTLAITSGGTGATTLSGILKGNGTSAITGSATLNDVGTPTTSYSMGSQRITSVADPSANQDVATKAYVDSVATGLDAKASVIAATTTAGTLASSFENGDTIDGIVLATNDRILIKNQVTASQNGIYTVNASGAPTRATDADVDAEVTNGMYTFVTSGTSNANTGWVLTTPNPITLGSTSLTFAQFSAANTVSAGNGLILTGSTIDAVGTSNRISVASDSIDISTSYVGQASITTLGTISSGTWSATAIAIANGGTGATTASSARTNLGLGTIATQDSNSVTITGGTITGITDLTVADGGTGVSTFTTNGILQGNGTSAVSAIIPAANGTVLMSNGTTASFATISNSSLTGGAYSAITGVGTLTSGSLGSGFTQVAVAQGGTGATAKTAAFDNLSPLTTQGDIIYHDGTNNVRLAKGTAAQVLTMNGGATAPSWVTPSAGTSNYRTLVTLVSDVASTASTSFQNITGLSFSVTSGTTYRFYALLVYTASATTIGLKGSLTSPAITLLAYTTRTPLAAAGTASNEWVNGAATTDAAAITSSTSSATTTGNIMIIEGVIKPSASGTLQLRFAPETATASGIVIKAGSTLEYW
jgi:hypothetical protein